MDIFQGGVRVLGARGEWGGHRRETALLVEWVVKLALSKTVGGVATPTTPLAEVVRGSLVRVGLFLTFCRGGGRQREREGEREREGDSEGQIYSRYSLLREWAHLGTRLTPTAHVQSQDSHMIVT